MPLIEKLEPSNMKEVWRSFKFNALAWRRNECPIKYRWLSLGIGNGLVTRQNLNKRIDIQKVDCAAQVTIRFGLKFSVG